PLGEVRLHVDDTAARSASAIGAKAYTFGNHVVFGAGHYRPDSRVGAGLLAHELTHVVQQSSRPTLPAPGSLAIGAHDAPAERTARAMSESISSGKTPWGAISHDDEVAIRRQSADEIDVDLAPVTQEEADQAKAMGVKLPQVSRSTFEKMAGPVNHGGQALTDRDKQAIAAFL